MIFITFSKIGYFWGDVKGLCMFLKVLRIALIAVCAAFLLGGGGGCTNSRTFSRGEDDPLRFDYESFQEVPKECLARIKDSVEKKFGTEYSYKNTIRSREKPYRESIFAKIEGKGADSTVVVKFDSLCNIKRIFRSLMTFQGEE